MMCVIVLAWSAPKNIIELSEILFLKLFMNLIY